MRTRAPCRFPCCPRDAYTRGLCKRHWTVCVRHGWMDRYGLPPLTAGRRRMRRGDTDPDANLVPPPEDPEYVAEMRARIAAAKAAKRTARAVK